MHYRVSKICFGGHFLENCFYCYSQQIKFVVANESLIPYKLIEMAPFLGRELLFIETWHT